MTIDEIREKYYCDKRQTGQVALNPLEKGGIDFRKAGPNDPVLPGLKRAVRAKVKSAAGPDDVAKRAQELREKKALVLQDLRSIEAYVKKLNDVKSIRNQIERIYPRMIGYLK